MALAMPAIYRVDGNSVVTSPNAAGPWDRRMQHGSAPSALVTWAAERIPTPVPMNDRARHHRSDAPGAGGAAHDRDRGAARGPQDPALRGQAARRRRAGRRRHRAQDQAAGAAAARRRQGVAGHAAVARGFAGRGRSRRDQSVRPGMVSMRAARGRFGQAGAGAIWFRARPSAGRRRSDLAGDARRGRRRFLQRHRLDARLPHLDLHQCRPHR